MSSYEQLVIRQALEGEPVQRFMTKDPVTVRPSILLKQLVDDYVYKYHYKMFPIVEDSGQLVGCITTKHVKDVPRQEWDTKHVSDISEPCSEENVIPPQTDAMKALSLMNRTGASRLIVASGALLQRPRGARRGEPVITPALLARVACPVCLEPAGCPDCAVPAAAGHASCEAYAARAGCACGGPDKPRLTEAEAGAALVCRCCAARYPCHAAGVVDLVPRAALGAVTLYADHEFHERLHVADAPPLLSAGVKADVTHALLGLRPGEAVLDLGCGAGKLALQAAATGAAVTGLDIAPFFLSRTLERVELVLGDLRRLPFRRGAYPAAYSLDVLEHLDEQSVFEVLREARRTLAPGGPLAVYTHAMESSRLAGFQRGVNRLARRLGERGLVDREQRARQQGWQRRLEGLVHAGGTTAAGRRLQGPGAGARRNAGRSAVWARYSRLQGR